MKLKANEIWECVMCSGNSLDIYLLGRWWHDYRWGQLFGVFMCRCVRGLYKHGHFFAVFFNMAEQSRYSPEGAFWLSVTLTNPTTEDENTEHLDLAVTSVMSVICMVIHRRRVYMQGGELPTLNTHLFHMQTLPFMPATNTGNDVKAACLFFLED